MLSGAQRYGCAACLPTAASLVHELIEAADERRLQRLQKLLTNQDLLIIDELGFVPLSKTGAELLFEVISQCYGKAAASEDDQGVISASAKYFVVTENLRRFVLEAVDRSQAGDAQPAVRARLGKGIAPTIFFERDQTTYRLPQAPFATAD